MAEVDVRIETLEDEIKVLKGEVRRTLVDLRALLMREDSPLNDGSLGRRGSLSQPESGEPPLTKLEVLEIMKQFSAGPANSPVAVTPAPSPPPAPPPGPASGDPASADQERLLNEQRRSMDEQQQRLDDQQRRMEEQERRLAEQQRKADSPDPDFADQKRRPEEPQLLMDEQQRRVEGQQRLMDERQQMVASGERGAAGIDRADAGAEPDGNKGPGERGPVGRPAWGPVGRPLAGGPGDADSYEEPGMTPPSSRDDARSKQNGRRGAGRSRAEAGRSRVETEDRDDGDPPRAGNGLSSRVYEEYLDLLEEAEGPDALEGEDQLPAPIDINLLSSLTRWTSIAKQRVGEQRLSDILDLYSQSGHLSPAMRELLARISSMVDEAPAKANHDVEECVDLISHLHGILAGGLPIPQVWLARISGKP